MKFFKPKNKNAPAVYDLQKADDFATDKDGLYSTNSKRIEPDFSSTHKSIMKIWNEIGVNPCTIETNTIFYSGIRTSSPIKNIDDLLRNRKNLWMSQSASYAGEYCYRDSGSTMSFALLKLRLNKPLILLEFPNSFHPATAFFEYTETDSGFSVDFSSPPKYQWFAHGQADHHVDVYFREIVKNGKFKPEPTGHFRRAIKHELGAIPGEIIELFITDLSAIETVDWVVPPATKREYLDLIEADRENAASVLFL